MGKSTKGRHYIFRKSVYFILSIIALQILTIILAGGTTALAAENDEDIFKNKGADINIPVRMEMLGLEIETKGRYLITLGFDCGQKSAEEFAKEFSENFSGEIEVLYRGQFYKAFSLDDYISFAPVPVGEGFGPVYMLDIHYSTSWSGSFDIYPRIRAKKAADFSLSIAYQKRPVGERLLSGLHSLFSTKKNVPQRKSITVDPVKFPYEAEFKRANVGITKEGDYGFAIGFPCEKVPMVGEKHKRLYRDFNGKIEILQNDRHQLDIQYNDAKAAGRVAGSKYIGLSYFPIDTPLGFCSIIPGIYSRDRYVCGLDFGRLIIRK